MKRLDIKKYFKINKNEKFSIFLGVNRGWGVVGRAGGGKMKNVLMQSFRGEFRALEFIKFL